MKYFKIARKLFNETTGKYESDVITIHEGDYNATVSQPEYQRSLRNQAVATPIELTIIESFASHKDYLEAQKNGTSGKLEGVEIEHTEKSLSKLKAEELDALISAYGVENTATNKAQKIEIILFQIELAKEKAE